MFDMTKKSDFQRVFCSFRTKHNQLFSCNSNNSTDKRLICETLIESIVRADFYDFKEVPRKRLFRVFYLLTKNMRYSDLQMYKLMSKYTDDDSIIEALEKDNWKFFINLFDIISMGWRQNDDVCSFLYRDWHEMSSLRMLGKDHRMW